jgi:glycosyltransferase involved in cell wall biosynthesis
MEIKGKNLALFFTRKVSLSMWHEVGMLPREIRTYVELSHAYKTIFFFTYGTKKDMQFANNLPQNIHIVCRPRYIPVTLYSILLPIIHRSVLHTVHILKTNQMDGSWSAVIAKKMYGGKLVVRSGYEWLQYLQRMKVSYLKRLFARIVEQFAYRNADAIIISSEEGKQFIQDRFHISANKVFLIPNYVDTQKFAPQSVAKDSKRIVFVGRLEKVKNLFNLISAMKGLDAHLVLIGKGSLRDQLEAHAHAEGVSVVFRGSVSQDDLPKELAQSAVFVLPSFSEGNPKVLLEAMSVGLAVVGSDITAINTIITHEKNGLICATDAVSIHATLGTLLANSQNRETFGLEARRTIETGFSLEKVLEKERAVYSDL